MPPCQEYSGFCHIIFRTVKWVETGRLRTVTLPMISRSGSAESRPIWGMTKLTHILASLASWGRERFKEGSKLFERLLAPAPPCPQALRVGGSWAEQADRIQIRWGFPCLLRSMQIFFFFFLSLTLNQWRKTFVIQWFRPSEPVSSWQVRHSNNNGRFLGCL